MVSSLHCAVLTSHRTILLSHLVVPLFFFSHLMVPFSYYAVPNHIWLYFCHIRRFLYFFLIFDGSILILCNTNITCGCTFVIFHIWWIFFFSLTLCSINITCVCTFVIFGGSLIFFSHLMVPSLHCVVPTSHVTVLLSHLVVLLFFFSHLIVPFSHYAVPTLHVTVLLSHSVDPLFFLTFDGIIFTLCSTNITCDYTFVTFGSCLIFSHIWWYHPHVMQCQYDMWLYLCHIRLY